MKLPRLSTGTLRLAVDSTGAKLYGEGEWKVRPHGEEQRRTWRKLHPLIDHTTHEAGYHRRSLSETAMMGLKTIFSDRLRAREWRRQETELRVRCAAMNRMTSLGVPRSDAV